MTFIHANDAAMGNLGYARMPADHYVTPEWVTEAVIPHLLPYQLHGTPVWEPACGNGQMSKVLEQHFPKVVSTDLHDYGYGQAGIDFLATEAHVKGIICTNPPYGDLAEAFIRHALKLTKRHCGAVAMLLRNEYDCAKSRVDLFDKPPFAKKVILLKRPRWIADSTGAPRHNYSWFVFSYLHQGPATVAYAKGGK